MQLDHGVPDLVGTQVVQELLTVDRPNRGRHLHRGPVGLMVVHFQVGHTLGHSLCVRGPEGVGVGVDDDEAPSEQEMVEHRGGCTSTGVQHKAVVDGAELIAEVVDSS